MYPTSFFITGVRVTSMETRLSFTLTMGARFGARVATSRVSRMSRPLSGGASLTLVVDEFAFTDNLLNQFLEALLGFRSFVTQPGRKNFPFEDVCHYRLESKRIVVGHSAQVPPFDT